MLGGFSVVMGIYMGTLVSYFVAFVALMAGYLAVYASTLVAYMMIFLS